jgi:NAD(P)-dependent dehydrogenase (short-subunit alcohol dehydrogenase family)
LSAEPVVLVTGAGRGLGRAIGEAFRAHDYRVVATDYDPTLLRDRDGLDGYTTAQLDVTDAESIAGVARFIAAEFGRLDVIVNNAGIIGYFPTVEMDPDQVLRHFQVNTFAALRVVHACLDLLVASRGTVVNITSESFRLRTPFQIYQTTKLALEGLSDVMRRELSGLGVHVATVRPGAIGTDLFHAMDSIENPVPDGHLARPFAAFVRRLDRNKPKRVSSPDEVAAVVFRAATAHRRRPHYAINNMRSLRIASMLPTSVADRAVARMLR